MNTLKGIMKKLILSICMAAALVGVSSCASTKNATEISSIDGEWYIIEVDGTAMVPAPGQSFPYISFRTKTGMMYGNSGCNSLTGTFDVKAKPGVLHLHALGNTRMACPDMAVEQKVLAALGRVRRYRQLDMKNMGLFGSSGHAVIVLQKKPRPSGKELPPVLHFEGMAEAGF